MVALSTGDGGTAYRRWWHCVQEMVALSTGDGCPTAPTPKKKTTCRQPYGGGAPHHQQSRPAGGVLTGRRLIASTCAVDETVILLTLSLHHF